MKKVLLIVAIAGAFAACNNASDSVQDKKDSIDSLASEKKETIDSSAEQRKAAVDSMTEKKKETLNRMDSLNKKDTSNNTRNTRKK